MTFETQEPEDARFGRRSLVRAGVWSVPVVSVVAAAPAFAACSGAPDLRSSAGSSSKGAGKTYLFTVTLKNTGGTTAALQAHATTTSSSGITSITASGSPWSGTGATVTSGSQLLCGASQATTTFTVTAVSGSSQTVALSFTGGNGGVYAPPSVTG